MSSLYFVGGVGEVSSRIDISGRTAGIDTGEVVCVTLISTNNCYSGRRVAR